RNYLGLFLALFLGLILVLLTTGSFKVSAEESAGLYVSPEGVDGTSCSQVVPCRTLQHAVDLASPGDEIRVAIGVYIGTQGRPAPVGYPGPHLITQSLYLSKTVTVRGGYSLDFETWNPELYTTTLDAQGTGRVVFVGDGISVTLQGLQLIGGDADGLSGYGVKMVEDAGGGVYVFSGTLSLQDVDLFDNVAGLGGGAFFHRGKVGLEESHVFANGATDGGGLYLYETGAATLTGNQVFSNTASSQGGGLLLYQGSGLIDGNIFLDNWASEGSGLYLYETQAATLTRNQVLSNTAYSRGGGLGLYQGRMLLNANTFSGNWAAEGGGLYLHEAEIATLKGNQIISNTAYSRGGGLSLYQGQTLLNANVFLDNRAAEGGGLYLHETGEATLTDNQVFSNTASSLGGGLMLYQGTSLLDGNVFFNNRAIKGGGLYLHEAMTATLTGNEVLSNTASSQGGGLMLYRGSTLLDGNVFLDNRAAEGGGLFVWDSDATVLNTIIAQNGAEVHGSGLHVLDATPRLVHVTLARNGSQVGDDGVGVHVGSGSTLALTNTLLVSHTVGLSVTHGATATVATAFVGHGPWANNLDWGGGGAIITTTPGYTGTPDFMDADGGDYHIGEASMALDRAVTTTVAHDIDGQARPYGAASDIGADEFMPHFIHLPSVLRSREEPLVCQPIEGVTYEAIIVLEANNPDAENQPDYNMGLRGYEPTEAYMGLIPCPDPDPLAPRIPGFFGDGRLATFLNVYRVRGWDSENWVSAPPPDTDPPVTMAGFEVEPQEIIKVPSSGYRIDPRGFQVLVLYAAQDRITLKYTREDSPSYGYMFHIENICVEPSLLELYEAMDEAGRTHLPALYGDQPFGRAIDGELGVVIRDTCTFMDPRCDGWW
ncbi:MAG: right-handed parallel beta-helix repeat-containing protein, partial [Anaerolineae bacterium]